MLAEGTMSPTVCAHCFGMLTSLSKPSNIFCLFAGLFYLHISLSCLVLNHYAEGGATEAYGSRAVCHSVCLSARISRHSLKTKR